MTGPDERASEPLAPATGETTPEPAPESGPESDTASSSSILSSSAVMAAGTIVSRLSGFVRSLLLAAALGASLRADLFTIANTIPNMLYILLAGGVFNAVLVPQLVRAMRNDADRGEAYTNRIITLAGLFLLAVTVLLVVAAPLVMDLYLDNKYDADQLAQQRESIINLARYCLPQVFFYGMFVLVGQILNARGRFGPMMWAPIANNVISMAVLAAYLFVFGPAEGAEVFGAFSPRQEALLGIGSTLGIAVQFLLLVPFLRAAGFRYRPRFDFRGTGLGHTLQLGKWTLLFVLVNQIAYTVVVRLASSGTADAGAGSEGTGYFVYSSTFLIVMVPHSVITVSLATAILPRLSSYAAEERLGELGRTLSSTLRSALAVIVPFVVLLPFVADYIAAVLWRHGAATDMYELFVPSLALFGPGLLFFTFHYLMLRGFYALERTRTVFWVQCVIAAVNIGMAVLLVRQSDPAGTAPSLVIAYGTSYLVGAAISYLLLSRTIGGMQSAALVRFVVRIGIAVVVATVATWLVSEAMHGALAPDDGWVYALIGGSVVAAVDLLVFLAMARLLHIREVTEILSIITKRLPVRR